MQDDITRLQDIANELQSIAARMGGNTTGSTTSNTNMGDTSSGTFSDTTDNY